MIYVYMLVITKDWKQLKYLLMRPVKQIPVGLSSRIVYSHKQQGSSLCPKIE